MIKVKIKFFTPLQDHLTGTLFFNRHLVSTSYLCVLNMTMINWHDKSQDVKSTERLQSSRTRDPGIYLSWPCVFKTGWREDGEDQEVQTHNRVVHPGCEREEESISSLQQEYKWSQSSNPGHLHWLGTRHKKKVVWAGFWNDYRVSGIVLLSQENSRLALIVAEV